MKNRTAKSDFKKWDKWQKSFDRIKKELEFLYFAKGMLERLRDHENVKSCPNKIFLKYLNNTYVVYLAMGIRRLVDKTSRAQNLYQVLEDIKKRACEISIENYVEYIYKKVHQKRIEDYPDRTEEEKIFLEQSCRKSIHGSAERFFKESLGENVQTLLCCEVEKDIDELRKTTEKVKNLTDKCWAHMDKDRDKLSKIPFEEAHKAFNKLTELYDKYSALIGVNKFEPNDNVFFNGWDEIFLKETFDKK